MSMHNQGFMSQIGEVERRATFGRPVVRLLLLQMPVLLLLACIALVCVALGVPVSAFTRDPAAIANINPLNGMVSHIGTMLWSVTAGVCIFSGLLLRRMERNDNWAGFFQYFGGLTTMLLLDDLFLIHDEIVPAAFSVAELPVYALYGSILCYGIYRYWRGLLVHRFKLFAVAVMFFAISVGFDVIVDEAGDWVFWIEDGAKVLGILNWCAFFTSLALYVVLRPNVQGAR